jgi:hypothetical protein
MRLIFNKINGYAPIAQLDRAADYGSKKGLFAMFGFGNQSLICSMSTMVLFVSAFAMFGRIWL